MERNSPEHWILIVKKLEKTSRWLMAGTLITLFQVLLSPTDINNFYSPFVINSFIVLQQLSLLSGLIFLFAYELESDLYKQPLPEVPNYIRKIPTITKQDVIVELKNHWPVLAQFVFFSIGYIWLFYHYSKKLV